MRVMMGLRIEVDPDRFVEVLGQNGDLLRAVSERSRQPLDTPDRF